MVVALPLESRVKALLVPRVPPEDITKLSLTSSSAPIDHFGEDEIENLSVLSPPPPLPTANLTVVVTVARVNSLAVVQSVPSPTIT